MLHNTDFLDVPAGIASHTRLAALCCLFQVRQNPLVVSNYLRFAATLQAVGIPLYTIECTLPGEPFAIPQTGTTMRRVAKTVGWHKERLLNILARRVPPRFTKLAWLDADIILHNQSWAYETERLLDHHHVVQPFTAARWLDQNGKTLPEVQGPDVRCCDGSVAYLTQHGLVPTLFANTHPGFAWAMRRDTWLSLGGLCDRVLTMAGDSVMLCGFTNMYWQPEVRQHCDRIKSIADWFQLAHETVGGDLVSVPGMVDHLWHGYWNNRQYMSFGQKIFALNHDFDAAVVEDPAGPGDQVRIVRDPALLAIYRRYFKIRNTVIRT